MEFSGVKMIIFIAVTALMKRWKIALIVMFFWSFSDFRYCQYNLCRGNRDIRCSKGCNHRHHHLHRRHRSTQKLLIFFLMDAARIRGRCCVPITLYCFLFVELDRDCHSKLLKELKARWYSRLLSKFSFTRSHRWPAPPLWGIFETQQRQMTVRSAYGKKDSFNSKWVEGAGPCFFTFSQSSTLLEPIFFVFFSLHNKEYRHVSSNIIYESWCCCYLL